MVTFAKPKQFALSLSLLLAVSNLTAAQASAKTFLESKSAGFTIKWTQQDLSAVNAQGPVFAASKLARAERLPRSAKTTVDRSFKLLSLVGPVLSYQDEQTLDWPGMVHPGVGDVRRYQAVDLRHPQKKALLTDYVAQEDIYTSLMANATVKKALRGYGQPRTLTDLIKILQTADVEQNDSEGNPARLLFNKDMLGQFAFTNLSAKGVEVAISLYDQANNDISPIKLNLPLKNPELSQWLKDAGEKKAGILLDKIKVAEDAETDFHFDP